jgi:murein DD-endopeptidase MepM/ murein hydrolase activator NlpD
VIIEHLPGVYSLYYHLDKITASEGAVVAAGELIGQSGTTGLSTAPHLHWEIRVSGESADPDTFITRPILDKKSILSIIDP